MTPTPKWFMDRRTVLRGAGGVAIALPFLDVMRARTARAADPPPKRFLVYFTPGGTVMENWRPSGSETAFTLPKILQPLDTLKSKITVIDGLDLKVTGEGFGHPHSRGMGGVLTGQPLLAGPYETCGGKAGFAAGPSIDQAIANKLSMGLKFKSLEVAVNWPTDRRDGGKAAPTNCINYSGPNQAVPMSVDPKAVFDRLFKDFGADAATLAAEKARSKSILDTVVKEYERMTTKVSRDDRAKLDEHLTRIREVEVALDASDGSAMGACKKPVEPKPLGDVSAGNRGSVGSSDQKNVIIDPRMPELGKSMMDLLVMALACDLTRVGTMQWADSQSYNTFPWLNLNDGHHGYQHDHGYQPAALTTIYNWYMGQAAYLATQLEAIKEGDKSLLDNTAILCVSEISHPNSHAQNNMPFVLIGNAGGALKSGRFLRYQSLPHNNLLLTIANAYGLGMQKFGKPNYCTGTLAGLA